jgi:hypothetical protein
MEGVEQRDLDGRGVGTMEAGARWSSAWPRQRAYGGGAGEEAGGGGGSSPEASVRGGSYNPGAGRAQRAWRRQRGHCGSVGPDHVGACGGPSGLGDPGAARVRVRVHRPL